ncbi:MAG: hypothetical protein DMG71_00455 [Acidobacteria bacterium]|nr:MAG: hypothetical protein DMG71_00455 [Acidobacteriota bacterium]
MLPWPMLPWEEDEPCVPIEPDWEGELVDDPCEVEEPCVALGDDDVPCEVEEPCVALGDDDVDPWLSLCANATIANANNIANNNGTFFIFKTPLNFGFRFGK